MEAFTQPRAAEPKPTRSDRELALRLGSLMVHLLGAGGGEAFRAIDESGLTFAQTKALFLVAARDEERPTSVKLIAEGLEISVPSASRAVDCLVKGGFATRVEDPGDRRVRNVSLTPKGRELADEVLAARLGGIERFAASLSAAERRKLEAALEALMKRDEIASTYRSHRRRERGR